MGLRNKWTGEGCCFLSGKKGKGIGEWRRRDGDGRWARRLRHGGEWTWEAETESEKEREKGIINGLGIL